MWSEDIFVGKDLRSRFNEMSFITNLAHRSWTSVKLRFSKINPGEFLKVFFRSHKAKERVMEHSVIVNRLYSLASLSDGIEHFKSGQMLILQSVQVIFVVCEILLLHTVRIPYFVMFEAHNNFESFTILVFEMPPQRFFKSEEFCYTAYVVVK